MIADKVKAECLKKREEFVGELALKSISLVL
jgi:hypothetical protein